MNHIIRKARKSGGRTLLSKRKYHMGLEESIKPLLDSRLSLLRIQGHQVILTVHGKMPSGKRGKLLLDTEKQLRKTLGEPLEVFLEPRGDLNKLRKQLRGVELDGSRENIYDERYTASDPKLSEGTTTNG